MNGASLPIGFGPQLVDGFDQPRRTIRYHQPRRPQSAPHEVTTQVKPILVAFALAQPHGYQYALALGRVPPCHQYALLLTAGSRRQIDGVQKHRQQFDVAEATAAERLVAGAQLAADAASGALGHLAKSGFRHQAFDVAVRQPAYVATNDQRFQRSRPDHGSTVRKHAADEPFSRAANLRHVDAEFAFSGLDRLRAPAIA
jgi:hypothetical protein